MTLPISEKSVEELTGLFLKYQNLRLRAVRALDVPAVNRNVLRSAAVVDELSRLPAGRSEMEKLLDAPSAYLRVRTAGAVMRWAPEKAIPVFGSMLDANLSSVESADERLEIRTISEDWLFRHFSIRSADRNDLIEPLRAYGIELARQDRSRW